MFSDIDKDGEIDAANELLSISNYYPFGMSWENNTKTSPLQRHLYNGKELDTDFSLNVYFYGARLHDPAIGRFTTVDPISDRFPWVSTYNYAENRPVNGIDLHGLQYVPFSSATFQMTGYDKEQHQRDVQEYLQGQKERGKEIIDEIPYVGEAKAASEGDVIGVLLAMIPGGSFFKKGKKLRKKTETSFEAGPDEGAIHHIATDKNRKSTARGGPWTPRLEEFFEGAGMDISKDLDNLVRIPGHKGPHPEEYHQFVFDALNNATRGLEKGGGDYIEAVQQTLREIAEDATTQGSYLNDILIKNK